MITRFVLLVGLFLAPVCASEGALPRSSRPNSEVSHSHPVVEMFLCGIVEGGRVWTTLPRPPVPVSGVMSDPLMNLTFDGFPRYSDNVVAHAVHLTNGRLLVIVGENHYMACGHYMPHDSVRRLMDLAGVYLCELSGDVLGGALSVSPAEMAEREAYASKFIVSSRGLPDPEKLFANFIYSNPEDYKGGASERLQEDAAKRADRQNISVDGSWYERNSISLDSAIVKRLSALFGVSPDFFEGAELAPKLICYDGGYISRIGGYSQDIQSLAARMNREVFEALACRSSVPVLGLETREDRGVALRSEFKRFWDSEEVPSVTMYWPLPISPARPLDSWSDYMYGRIDNLNSLVRWAPSGAKTTNTYEAMRRAEEAIHRAEGGLGVLQRAEMRTAPWSVAEVAELAGTHMSTEGYPGTLRVRDDSWAKRFAASEFSRPSGDTRLVVMGCGSDHTLDFIRAIAEKGVLDPASQMYPITGAQLPDVLDALELRQAGLSAHVDPDYAWALPQADRRRRAEAGGGGAAGSAPEDF